MLVDWFTVAAQALNFLVLAWLLKRFLYRPVLDAIDAREATIAHRLAEAQAAAEQARKQRADYEDKLAALHRDEAALMTRATQQADAEGQRLLEEGRRAAQELARRRKDGVEAAALRLQQSFAERVQAEALAATRKMLAELAGADLQEQMLDRFLRRLRELPVEQRDRLHAGPAAQLRVRSGVELSPPQRAALAAAVREVAGRDLPLRIDTDPALVAGLELAADGWKFAWNLAEATQSLEAIARDLLADGMAPAAAGAGAEHAG